MAKAPHTLALARLQEALDELIAATGGPLSAHATRKLRQGLAEHAIALEAARERTDPVALPKVTFDPGDPKIVGRMVSLGVIAQNRAALADISPAYGSGVYAIYYHGDHPLYRPISGTETPIYVGKADPADPEASNPREQGDKLTGRLLEHQRTILTSQRYASEVGLPDGLNGLALEDFSCRRLVCATNAQLVAERHLIRMFRPVWNYDTKACWGMSKHGDSAGTRSNKRSPWHVVHPGKPDMLDERLIDALTPDEIAGKVGAVFSETPPRMDHAELVEEMLRSFRQDETGRALTAEAEAEEVASDDDQP